MKNRIVLRHCPYCQKEVGIEIGKHYIRLLEKETACIIQNTTKKYQRKHKKTALLLMSGLTVFYGVAACTMSLGTAYALSKAWIESSLIGGGVTVFFIVGFLLFLHWTKDVIADKPLRWTWENEYFTSFNTEETKEK